MTMTPDDAALADAVYAAIQDYSKNSERGLQAQEFRIGPSDLGFCSERTRRMLDRQVPEDTDYLKAFIGTAIGDHVEKAVAKAMPEALIQQTVTVTLHGTDRTYTITGHPDICLPGLVIDGKTSGGLEIARRTGADQAKQFQRHLYGLGAWEAGLLGDIPLEEVRVGNLWVDRTGEEQGVHVQTEPYNPEIVAAATTWLEDVIYAYTNGEEARKEPPREMCAKVCGFYRTCRAFDTDVSGLLTDPEVLTAVEMYREGLALEKQGAALKKQAKSPLVGVTGSTGEFSVRWVHINETVVPETKRAAYDRLDLRPIPKSKK